LPSGRHRPHSIVDTVADLLPVIAEIEMRMAKGERSQGGARPSPTAVAATAFHT
jgi:hypothetical protein